MKNFAMLGKWHVHAPQYAEMLNALPDCRVVKVWDPDEATAKAWADELKCEAASVENILADPAIEGVVIGNATNEHAPVLLKACASGKAVFTEKVLTLTTAEAIEVRDAAAKYGTRFAISFPHFSDPGVIFALEAARSGKLGKLNYARVRKAHNGATADWLPAHFYDATACGGGAMIDLGAHPMYLLCALLGMPTRVQSAFTNVTDKPVEDNAVSLLTFEGGAIGVSETSFVSCKYPLTVELGGTDGSLLMRDDELSYCCAETGYEWKTVEKLPEKLPRPLEQWAYAKTAADIPADFGMDAAVRLTEVMEMAYKK